MRAKLLVCHSSLKLILCCSSAQLKFALKTSVKRNGSYLLFFPSPLNDISSIADRNLPSVFSLYNIILCLNNLQGEIQPDVDSVPSGKYSYIFLSKLLFWDLV